MIEAIAAVMAAVAIAAGAFGAHGAEGQAAEWLKTGSSYLLPHTVAVILLAKSSSGPTNLLLVGATIFASTLYLMALGLPRWLGAVTPIGGILMIAASYLVSSWFLMSLLSIGLIVAVHQLMKRGY